MRGWISALAAAAALALIGAAAAHASPVYRAVDLGTLGGFSQGMDVNSSGLVAGASGDHAFAWTAAGGMVDLGTLGGPRSYANHVTESGQVTGDAYVTTANWHPFSWTASDGIVDVGTLGGANASANDIADTGQIVGQSNWSGFPPQLKAFSWTSAGGIVDLGMLRLSVTLANAVNEQGQVVGWNGRAFIWSPPTGMQDVGALEGSNFSVATDVNDDGLVVGYSSGPVDGPHVFSWTQTGGMVDLGPAQTSWVAVNDAGEIAYTTGPSGATHVIVLAPAGQPVDIGTLGGTSATLGGQYPSEALNDAGQLVGRSTTADGSSHAFVWSLDDGMVDLGTLGGATSQANAISENGLVTGSSNVADGTIHPVLWQPQRDTTPPSLTTTDVAVDATGPAGATADFVVTATDDTDPAPTVVCTPPSGSLFAIGDTAVTCTATDASENAATGTFVVHVRGATEQAVNLAADVRALPLPRLVTTGLCTLLRGPTVLGLRLFVRAVDALPDALLAPADAERLIASALRIESVLGR